MISHQEGEAQVCGDQISPDRSAAHPCCPEQGGSAWRVWLVTFGVAGTFGALGFALGMHSAGVATTPAVVPPPRGDTAITLTVTETKHFVLQAVAGRADAANSRGGFQSTRAAKEGAGGIAVPASAVVHEGVQPVVWVAETPTHFVRHPVSIDESGIVGDTVRILSGIQPGEQVVVQGGIFLSHMRRHPTE